MGCLGLFVGGGEETSYLKREGDGCDEIHFAPPKKPWNDDSPASSNTQWSRGAGIRPPTVCCSFLFTGGWGENYVFEKGRVMGVRLKAE